MECNRCFCTSAAKLLCTQIACVDWTRYTPLKPHKKLLASAAARHGKTNKTLKNKSKSKNKNKKKLNKRGTGKRQGKSKTGQKKKEDLFQSPKIKVKTLPELPKGDCVPGRVYKSECKRCFCDESRKAQCALKSEACPCKDSHLKPISVPEDIHPPFSREELKKVKTLMSASERCDPGHRYKVSCNLCVCTEKGNLLCSKELCLSFEDINRVEAAEKSGENCTADPSPTKKGCVECKCVKSKLSCVDIPNCYADTRLVLSNGGKKDIKLKIDPLKEKCIPQGIYRDNCNRCYCQKDGSLRCTQKTCLVYSQAEELRKQLQKLKN